MHLFSLSLCMKLSIVFAEFSVSFLIRTNIREETLYSVKRAEYFGNLEMSCAIASFLLIMIRLRIEG